MSDDKPRRPTLEELRARAAGKPLPSDPAYQAAEEGPRVVCLRTRAEYVPQAPKEPGKKPHVNAVLVDELENLLDLARRGSITSMSYVTYSPHDGTFNAYSIMPIDGVETSEAHALRHLGAIKFLEEGLKELAYGDLLELDDWDEEDPTS